MAAFASKATIQRVRCSGRIIYSPLCKRGVRGDFPILLLLLAGLALLSGGVPYPALAQGVDDAITVPAPTTTSVPQWWTDTDISGNGPTSVGSIQRCRRIEDPTFQVDVVLFNVNGLGGFHFSFHFDSTYVEFASADVDFLLTSAGGTLAVVDVVQPDPDSVIVGAALEFPGPPASGSGVLARLTFNVKAPQGQTGLDVNPSFAGLQFITGDPIPSDPTQAKAQAVLDSTATVGCWTVDSTDDDDDLDPGDGIADANPTLGIVKPTLRAAIEEANAIEGANRISFRAPNALLGCGVPCTIAPESPLPPLQDSTGGTEVDGTTQPGIVVNGAAAGPAPHGFLVSSAGNVIKGLAVNGFASGAGVRITGSMATNNKVLGTRIGTNVLGTAAVPNQDGVVLENEAHDNWIGGMAPAERNIVSGNSKNGVYIRSGATANHVINSFIGTNTAGSAALGNSERGVYIQDAPKNVIEGNLISGNGGEPVLGYPGVHIDGSGAVENLIVSNFIGVDVNGSSKLPNQGGGVWVHAATDTIIGGQTNLPGTAPGNVISGNNGHGISIWVNEGLFSARTKVQGNLIGTDSSGLQKLGNLSGGVRLFRVADNLIGGPLPSQRNVISGNGTPFPPFNAHGVHITDGSRDNLVQGNYIGTNRHGEADMAEEIGNLGNGVHISHSPSNRIGGATDILGRAPGNVIAGNIGAGVHIVGEPATSNRLQGNLIGLTANGNGFGNSVGVRIHNGRDNLVGGTDPRERNVISFNNSDGVLILGGNAWRNKVQGNFIGTDQWGSPTRGNFRDGVMIEDTPPSIPPYQRSNWIGGEVAAAGNVIESNRRNGVTLLGAEENFVLGNTIRHNGTINPDFTREGYGVEITGGSIGNVIGGKPGGPRFKNTIEFNKKGGVGISKSVDKKNSIDPNGISSNGGLGIDLGDDGVTLNDPGDGDTGPNDRQNFPELTSATPDGSVTTVSGTLDSKPNTTFLLEFYSSAACDPSGYGEGETFLGDAMVTTGSSGIASFVVTLPPVPLTHVITATATDPDNNTSEFSRCLPVGVGISLTPFADFTAKLEVKDSEFDLKATFTLGATSDGIDIPTEIVSLELTGGSGGYSVTIPAGSFKKDKKGRFKFEGVIDGVALEVMLRPLSANRFEFKAEGKGVDLSDLANPVTVNLTIGNDTGATTLTAELAN